MNSNYGFDLESMVNKPSDISRLLAQFLNNGHLSLLLGGGVSIALKFPGWSQLVKNICDEWLPGHMDHTKSYTGTELKEIAQEVKRKINNTNLYLETVKKYLYD